jgi:hypothetical protein
MKTRPQTPRFTIGPYDFRSPKTKELTDTINARGEALDVRRAELAAQAEALANIDLTNASTNDMLSARDEVLRLRVEILKEEISIRNEFPSALSAFLNDQRGAIQAAESERMEVYLERGAFLRVNGFSFVPPDSELANPKPDSLTHRILGQADAVVAISKRIETIRTESSATCGKIENEHARQSALAEIKAIAAGALAGAGIEPKAAPVYCGHAGAFGVAGDPRWQPPGRRPGGASDSSPPGRGRFGICWNEVQRLVAAGFLGARVGRGEAAGPGCFSPGGIRVPSVRPVFPGNSAEWYLFWYLAGLCRGGKTW